YSPKRTTPQAAPPHPSGPSTRRYRKKRAWPSSYPILADAGSCPGNCSGMEEATGAPSSFAVTSEAAAGFRSRRGPSHDSTLVTPHNAPLSTYKAAGAAAPARAQGGRGWDARGLTWGNPQAQRERRDVQAAARALGQELIVVDVSGDRDIDAAFTTFV